MELIGYLSIFAMGAVLGIIGGGGSILTVPILVFLFSLSPLTSTAYSLFIVGTASAVGTIQSRKQIDWKLGFSFALPALIGSYTVRRFIMPQIPDLISFMGIQFTKNNFIINVFALTMFIVAFRMWPRKKVNNTEKSYNLVKDAKMYWLVVLVFGLATGLFTGFIGAGGGFIILPMLLILKPLSMKAAVSTSLMIITLNSVFGFLGESNHFAMFDWKFLIGILVVAAGGMTLGIFSQSVFSEKQLRHGFAAIVFVTGIFILI